MVSLLSESKFSDSDRKTWTIQWTLAIPDPVVVQNLSNPNDFDAGGQRSHVLNVLCNSQVIVQLWL